MLMGDVVDVNLMHLTCPAKFNESFTDLLCQEARKSKDPISFKLKGNYSGIPRIVTPGGYKRLG